MNIKPGFSVLELIMVMAVSSVMMSILLEIYNQVNRNMRRIERLVFEDTQILTLRNRFEQDLAGISAIWFTQADLEAKQAAKDGKKAEDSKQDKKLTAQYFYSVNKNQNLETLTFVTTSALQSYGTTQNRFVRVIYKLEQDPVHSGMFRLMRKEVSSPTENIDDSKNAKEGMFYELVSSIKSLEMTYQLIDKAEIKKRLESEKEAGKDIAKVSSTQENKPIIRSVKQWTGDSKSSSAKAPADKKVMEDVVDSAEEEEDLGGAAVPKFVTMKIVFGATHQQLEKEYQLDFYIPSFIDNMVKLAGKSSSAKAPVGEQPATPSSPAPAPSSPDKSAGEQAPTGDIKP